jgi:hypothetical protein
LSLTGIDSSFAYPSSGKAFAVLKKPDADIVASMESCVKHVQGRPGARILGSIRPKTTAGLLNTDQKQPFFPEFLGMESELPGTLAKFVLLLGRLPVGGHAVKMPVCLSDQAVLLLPGKSSF